ncbi:MAG: DUF2693 domain-containing protein [Lachnospiraceae bacterium]|nr:DUF2693 domain-containing protein [Lachnospiraceae bacterium]
MDYAEIFRNLTYQTAIIIFIKKNGEIRVMLGTRNLKTVELEYGFKGMELGGHDKRCNINNGNVAVYDMIVGEARSFSINRLVSIQYVGEITDRDTLNRVVEEYIKFKDEYEATKPKTLDIDTF